jgi:carbohydrate kinase (thermoresistant glucokinase family)
MPPILLIMGVAGVGKTTVAQELARALGVAFQEGDALHPPQNVAKMRAGTPLEDADRWPWLDRIAAQIDRWRREGKGGVITCSALKRAYRARVIGDRPEVRLVHLTGAPDLIRRRMAQRRDHYMPVALLDSQLAALEEPSQDERPIVVGIDAAADQIAARILAELVA